MALEFTFDDFPLQNQIQLPEQVILFLQNEEEMNVFLKGATQKLLLKISFLVLKLKDAATYSNFRLHSAELASLTLSSGSSP